MDFRLPQESSPSAPPWLGAFAHPAFAVVWAASTCALLGIAMYDTASGWLMTTLDLNPFDVSLVRTATTLPMFLFTLPAGAIADIVDPRRMIIAVSYGIAALIAVFAAAISLEFNSPLLLLATTFILSAAWSLNTPPGCRSCRSSCRSPRSPGPSRRMASAITSVAPLGPRWAAC